MTKLLKDIWNKIKESKRITILTHVNPDGDTIGSAVALKHLILDNIKNIEVKISGDRVPEYLSIVDENDEVSDEYFNSSQVIVVDTSNKKRVFDQRVVTKESIKIDHHHDEEEWLIGIGGDNWPATGEVLYELAVVNTLTISERSMEGIFVAIWTDTEGLTQRNFTSRTKEIVELLKIDKEKMLSSLKPSEEILNLIATLDKEVVVKDGVAFLYYDKEINNDYLRKIVGELSNQYKQEVFLSLIKTKNTFRGSLRSKG
ncbi:MAG: DHH family phosphoesterase, partial [Mycoplasmataceae bacterium]|nr:DHH family phosphoesterase [Mycoplasmataceae bacterium]